MALGPPDLGHRVVVRRLVGHREGRPMFSDALGELTAITDAALTVATRTGPVVIDRAAVVAAKRVPPRPVTRRAIIDLETAANQAWPAPEQERLGGWLLRAAGGWSNRANAALPLGDAGLPPVEAITRVRRWYAERGLSAAISTPLPLAARLGTLLDQHGWHRGTPVLVQTAGLAGVREAAGEPEAVALTESPSADWLDLAGSYRSQPAAVLPPVAHRVLEGDGSLAVRFAHLLDAGGQLVAAGRGTVTGGGRWLGLSRVAVTPAARRRGLARQVVAGLALWAHELGATDVFLQVEKDNLAGIGLYAGLGFATHHTYVTRWEP